MGVINRLAGDFRRFWPGYLVVAAMYASAVWLLLPHAAGGGFAHPIHISQDTAEHGSWYSVSTDEIAYTPRLYYLMLKFSAARSEASEQTPDGTYESMSSHRSGIDAARVAEATVSGQPVADEPTGVVLRTWLSRGASAGLPLTLAGIDIRSDGDLTSGRKIAATGVVRPDGTVREISGMTNKARAAQVEGVTVLIVPLPNYAEAVDAVGDNGVEVVPVVHVSDALFYLCQQSTDSVCAK